VITGHDRGHTNPSPAGIAVAVSAVTHPHRAGGVMLRLRAPTIPLTVRPLLTVHRRTRPHALPSRRGSWHRALLSARLAEAAAAGCDIAVVTTQPGSRSQQNVQRQGFDPLYTRAILVKATTVTP
jgi:hypothetical protein